MVRHASSVDAIISLLSRRICAVMGFGDLVVAAPVIFPLRCVDPSEVASDAGCASAVKSRSTRDARRCGVVRSEVELGRRVISETNSVKVSASCVRAELRVGASGFLLSCYYSPRADS